MSCLSRQCIVRDSTLILTELECWDDTATLDSLMNMSILFNIMLRNQGGIKARDQTILIPEIHSTEPMQLSQAKITHVE